MGLALRPKKKQKKNKKIKRCGNRKGLLLLLGFRALEAGGIFPENVQETFVGKSQLEWKFEVCRQKLRMKFVCKFVSRNGNYETT